MSNDPIEAIRQRAEAATPGPWRWDGYTRGPMHLSTTHSGRRFVMNFARLGMQDAQPVFQVYNDRGNGLMVKGQDLAVREVEYREDIVGFDNPDATFIAHSRQDVDVLLTEIDRLRALVEKRVEAT